ncbi:MAG: ATP-binding cassette domain-containing protein [Candidatus Spechtbacteria bacterium SB0662_bin_43]|uniref:ATP-binding cassette domain-containing protein n=1 Tax=Candidatus Spechtbacteria bacterium SB0662_bin_43 TaxID=2604897 RepID=A0A845DIJ2_9BACT|nr:ATP-binding cassette domain-containing protein [Candidatus Spechtbacteria bacterium SB0662_bin_43]
MLIFDNVSKKYGEFHALQKVSFQVDENEFVSLVGKSGAGKSTLLKLLLREERPSHGKVFFEGIDIGGFHDSDLPLYRRRIAPVFQDFKLLASKNVFENVAFAMEAAGKSQRDIKEDVPQALDIVDLQSKKDRFPHQLSGGEQQRVSIARALVQRPQVLLADEPTGNLDPVHSWDIVNLLLKINELGTSILLATHSEDIVNVLERRVITLDDGKVVSDEKKGKYEIVEKKEGARVKA